MAAFDIGQRCSGFLYGLDLADALFAGERADTVAVVGAETHAGFLPSSEVSWRSLVDETVTVGPEDHDSNTTYRVWSVLSETGPER